MEDIIRVKGEVTLTLTYMDGRTKTIHLDNLVVNGGKTILSRLLGHDESYSGEFIDKIAFGTGSTPPAASDTSLAAQVLTKDVTVTYPAFNKVMFSATMQANEGGSNTFREIGLLSAGTNKLFSRLSITPIAKSSLYMIKVDWTISFQ